MASLLLLFFRIESSPGAPVFQEDLCQILQILVLARRLHRLHRLHHLLRPHRNGPLAPPPRISLPAPLPDRLAALMAVAGCVHGPLALAVVPLEAPVVARVPLALVAAPAALAVAPVVARVPAVPAALAVAPVVARVPAAMARAVAAEVGHMAAAMAMDHQQPRHARWQPPSSRVGRSRFRHKSSSRIWRRCSMSRSMKSSAT